MKNLLLSIRFGLVTGAVLISYFLVLSLFDKHSNPVFSLLNAPITLLGIYEVIKISKLRFPESFTYTEGFKSGVVTGGVATILFTLFFLLYSTEITPEYLPALFEKMHWGLKLHVGLIVFIVAIMGFSTSVVSSLTVMQLFKTSNNYAESV
jgi:hypothetical protein